MPARCLCCRFFFVSWFGRPTAGVFWTGTDMKVNSGCRREANLIQAGTFYGQSRRGFITWAQKTNAPTRRAQFAQRSVSESVCDLRFVPAAERGFGDIRFDCELSRAMAAAEPEFLVEEKNGVAIGTLNRPSKLNCITLPMIQLAIRRYKQWEEDDSTKVVILKGNGRVFCAGGDLNMFYRLGKSDEGWKEVVYVKYWFDYHLSTFKKPLIGIWHGLVMGGGAGLTVLGRFRVATEKTVFAMPEVGIGFHPDCGASYWLSHLPGSLGEYIALLGTRLDGADLYASGLATHYVPVQKLPELEQRLLKLETGGFDEVDAALKEFDVPAKLGPNSIFTTERRSLIDRVFSKASVEEIISALESESNEPGQEWAKEPLKVLRRSSPTALKVTLQSVRTGRKQTLPEAIQREYRLTINCLRAIASEDLYEGIRAIVIDKDNKPKWRPASLGEVTGDMMDRMVNSFNEEEDLRLPSDGKTPRWHGSWEETQKV